MRGVVWALFVVSACMEPQLVPCGDRLCPGGSVCLQDRCATQAQVDACTDIADGEPCATATSPGVCDRGVCTPSACGNTVVDPNEQCDDGNIVSGDGCRGDCRKIEVCGDGVVDEGEACDDGNTNAADGCDMCTATRWRARAAIGRQTNGLDASITPNGLAMDRSGNIYFADNDNHRVRKIDPQGRIVTVAGTGTQGNSGDGGPALAARLYRPNDVAVDGLGNVYITDSGTRVRRVDPSGIITTIAGNGTFGTTGDGGPATAAQLSFASAVAVDGIGSVYIADGDRVRVVSPTGTISTFAGGGTGGDNGPAATADLGGPSDIVLDAAGNVLIADFIAHKIRRVDAAGIITTVAGIGVTGTNGDGGPATAAELWGPYGVTVDATGNLYISDGRDRIRRVDTAGVITTIAGGAKGFGGDGGLATSALLDTPDGVAVGSDGTLYIADYLNYRIRAVTSGTIRTFAGTGAPFEDVAAQATAVEIPYPYAVTTDGAGNLYVGDVDSSRVLRIDANGVLTTVAGSGSGGFGGDGGPATKALMSAPWGMSFDPQGNLLIADAGNDRIRRVSPSGIITTIAGNGTRGFSGDGGPATSASLNIPYAVVSDSAGNIYIGDQDNHRVRKIDTNGIITTFAGTGADTTSGDGGLATSATLRAPLSLAVDAQDRLYILDTDAHRVRRVDTNGIISTIAGTTGGFSGDGGAAVAAQLLYPRGITVDAQGVLYIADSTNGRVRRVDTNGTITTVVGSAATQALGDGGAPTAAGLVWPTAVATYQGALYIVDTDDLRVRKVVGQTVTTVAGRVDPEGAGPLVRATLADPQALAVTPAITLFAGGAYGVLQAVRNAGTTLETVAGRYPQAVPTGALARYRDVSFGAVRGVATDTGTSRIFLTEGNRVHLITVTDVMTPTTWTITTLVNTANVAGSSDGPAATAKLRTPSGLYFDEAAQQLYVADTGNHAVRRIDLSAGVAAAMVTTVAGVPAVRGYFGDGSSPTSALLYEPRAITRCTNGDLFIADSGNHRVRRVAAGQITTVLGVGVAASSGEGLPASTFPVHDPRGLACDAAGNLYVTSTSTVRMLPANQDGVVDGSGAVQTIYGLPPRTTFPESATSCLTGLAVINAKTVQITDACAGLLVELVREPL